MSGRDSLAGFQAPSFWRQGAGASIHTDLSEISARPQRDLSALKSSDSADCSMTALEIIAFLCALMRLFCWMHLQITLQRRASAAEVSTECRRWHNAHLRRCVLFYQSSYLLFKLAQSKITNSNTPKRRTQSFFSRCTPHLALFKTESVCQTARTLCIIGQRRTSRTIPYWPAIQNSVWPLFFGKNFSGGAVLFAAILSDSEILRGFRQERCAKTSAKTSLQEVTSLGVTLGDVQS